MNAPEGGISCPDTTDEKSSSERPVPAAGERQVHAAGLAGLPGMTPVRLSKLLDGFDPVLAWKAVRAGTHPADPQRRFLAPARNIDLSEVEARHRRAGVKVLLPGMNEYPTILVGDPGAPAVLFVLGDSTVLEHRPRVAIVGTRSATHYGRQVASELARDLAAEGVVVVSGLARGIDGAAHAGALRAGGQASAPPVALVGTGLDVVYPPSNQELWEQVADRGAVFSESALGTKPHPGVFPARNRIIAALSDVVVVVESHYGGGSMYTAEAAARRSIPVCAVPGSVKSRASDGANALLVDGCTPVRDAVDVLVAVSLARTGMEQGVEQGHLGDRSGRAGSDVSHSGARAGDRRAVDATPSSKTTEGRRSGAFAESLVDRSMTAHQRAVLEAVDDSPTFLETILIRTDLSIASAAAACDQLVETGELICGVGWWSRSRA
jgi:DNA processing protein